MNKRLIAAELVKIAKSIEAAFPMKKEQMQTSGSDMVEDVITKAGFIERDAQSIAGYKNVLIDFFKVDPEEIKKDYTHGMAARGNMEQVLDNVDAIERWIPELRAKAEALQKFIENSLVESDKDAWN